MNKDRFWITATFWDPKGGCCSQVWLYITMEEYLILTSQWILITNTINSWQPNLTVFSLIQKKTVFPLPQMNKKTKQNQFSLPIRSASPHLYTDTTKIKPESSGQGCPRCGGSVFKAEEVVEKGQIFHKKCFTCIKCNRPQDDKLQVRKHCIIWKLKPY